MDATAHFFIAIGGILLLGLATDVLGRRTFLPRVTLLLIMGLVIGPEGFNLVPDSLSIRFELIAELALLMIGFLLGGRLTQREFRKNASAMVSISLTAAILTASLVALALMLSGVPLTLALLLGCIASATAPVATLDTVLESGGQSPFADLLLSIVALDDAWALMLFSLGIAFVNTVNSSMDSSSHVLHAMQDIFGAIALGMVIGLPAAYLTGRIKPGQPILTEALALVFLCGGLALFFKVSFLIASMIMGAVIANLARHHDYPFHAIENVEWPFMVIFFVLAGASLELDALTSLGYIGLLYIASRVFGKITGAYLGAKIARAEPVVRKWMGLAMLPQAGAAMGMALVASSYFPQFRQELLSVVISTTVFFELLGPVFTRYALRRASH